MSVVQARLLALRGLALAKIAGMGGIPPKVRYNKKSGYLVALPLALITSSLVELYHL